MAFETKRIICALFIMVFVFPVYAITIGFCLNIMWNRNGLLLFFLLGVPLIVSSICIVCGLWRLAYSVIAKKSAESD